MVKHLKCIILALIAILAISWYLYKYKFASKNTIVQSPKQKLPKEVQLSDSEKDLFTDKESMYSHESLESHKPHESHIKTRVNNDDKLIIDKIKQDDDTIESHLFNDAIDELNNLTDTESKKSENDKPENNSNTDDFFSDQDDSADDISQMTDISKLSKGSLDSNKSNESFSAL